jgi:uncharacterized RDD family membrane protein YckC
LLAYLIDWLLVSALSALVGRFFEAITGGPSWVEAVVITTVYWVGFWVTRGQTPGMMVFKLKLVSATTGRSVSAGQGVLRLLALAGSILLLGLGAVWIAVDARKQGWHDKIAHTLVVEQ